MPSRKRAIDSADAGNGTPAKASRLDAELSEQPPPCFVIRDTAGEPLPAEGNRWWDLSRLGRGAWRPAVTPTVDERLMTTAGEEEQDE